MNIVRRTFHDSTLYSAWPINKYDSALDFHVTMYDALPYKRDSDYLRATKTYFAQQKYDKILLICYKEDAYQIDNKDSHIKEILREIAAKQQKNSIPFPGSSGSPDEDSAPEQIQSLLETMLSIKYRNSADQTDFTISRK